MTATIKHTHDEPTYPHDEPTYPEQSSSKRAGYIVAIAINSGLLYVAHHLLEWGWLDFLTADFDKILPLLTFSFIVAIVVNAVFLVTDDLVTKSISDFLSSSIAVLVGIRTLQVFPFDFSGYTVDWSPVVALVLVLALVGIVIAMVVTFIKLAAGLLLR